MNNKNAFEDVFAITTWQLFLKNGFDATPRLIAPGFTEVTPKELKKAAQNPEVRKRMKNWIKHQKNKIQTVELMLED